MHNEKKQYETCKHSKSILYSDFFHGTSSLEKGYGAEKSPLGSVSTPSFRSRVRREFSGGQFTEKVWNSLWEGLFLDLHQRATTGEG
jgi:hypothetical protein